MCRRSPRQEQLSEESPWQSLNPPPFYLTYREYRSLFAAAWNNKAFAPSSNPTRHSGHTWCDLRTPSIRLNKMAWFRGFPVSAAKSTSGKQRDPCRRESKSTTRIQDIRLARTQTPGISEHANETGHYPLWDEVKVIDRDSHWYTRRVKEAIHIGLHPNNINSGNGIEIPEAWMPTVKKHSRRMVQQRTPEWTASRRNSADRTRTHFPWSHLLSIGYLDNPLAWTTFSFP